jgi:hypothetical protein
LGGCYEREEIDDARFCESEVTYKLGFRQVIRKHGVKVALFENVLEVAHSIKKDGVAHPPAVDIIQADMSKLGGTFGFCKVSSEFYFVRQRRNRVYGVVDLVERDHEEFSKQIGQTMQDLQSFVQFPFEDCFDTHFDTEAETERIGQRCLAQAEIVLEKASTKNKSSNWFLDANCSLTRTPEAAEGMMTCVRPTHAIYSTSLKRFVKDKELLSGQGVWRGDFEKPRSYDKLVAGGFGVSAQEFAGNAFTTTVMQATLITSLCHARSWHSVGAHDEKTTSASAQSLHVPLPEPAPNATVQPQDANKSYILANKS